MKKENYADRVSVSSEIDRYMESTRREEILTGFKTVDSVLGGLKSPGLVLLCARPSVGKTALARTIARNMAVDRGIPVAYFTLELSAIQMTRLFLVAESEMAKAKDADQRCEEFTEAIYKLKDTPLFIDDTRLMDMEAFRKKARTLVEEKEVKVFFVDYMQLLYWRMDWKHRDIDWGEETKRIVRELKQTAEDINIAIVALTQLPHAISRTEKEFTLGDMMKKMEFDQDFINDYVDMIWLLYRPDYYGLGDGRERAELNVVHNMHGRRGDTFDLRFNPEFVKFEDP